VFKRARPGGPQRQLTEIEAIYVSLIALEEKWRRQDEVSRILVVDDDPALLRVLSMGLGARGHVISTASTGRQAVTQVAMTAIDLVLLDLGLPDMDGLEVCRKMRATSNVPIIVLSADATEGRKIAALDGGADDYVVKPFGMGELEARIRLAARHWGEKVGVEETSPIVVGPLEIDLGKHRATMENKPVELTPREFDILAYLAHHAGKVMTHQMILTEVWGPGYMKDVHYLRVYVHRLRRILDDEHGAFLRTEPGIGYALVDPLSP
jgi:two-component system KDP operon response regulator KdpE